MRWLNPSRKTFRAATILFTLIAVLAALIEVADRDWVGIAWPLIAAGWCWIAYWRAMDVIRNDEYTRLGRNLLDWHTIRGGKR